MSAVDARGLPLSGATQVQAAQFDRIVGDYLDYRLTAFPALKELCAEAPSFALAHILKGFLLLSLGSQATVPGAKACAEHVRALGGMMDREALHLAALEAWAEGDVHRACAYWDTVLFQEPLDILALKLQHFSLFWQGQAARMRDAAQRVLPAFESGMQGHSHVQGMLAFALEETGEYARSERMGRDAVARHPDDLWAIHAVAHVYEMQGDLKQGIEWMNQPLNRWDDRNPFKDHLWWHTAMFALEKGEFGRVLELYDAAVWPDDSTFYLDVQNAASLLTRLEFFGVDVGKRWNALGVAAQDRNGDHVLLFTEPHYTMAFAHTGQSDEMDRQIASLKAFEQRATPQVARVIEQLAGPICTAIRDFYRGDYEATIQGLLPIRYDYQPIGGSHAQRDIFNLYLIEAALLANRMPLAKSLLKERVLQHPNSLGTWSKYAKLCDRIGDEDGAQKARTEINRIVMAA